MDVSRNVDGFSDGQTQQGAFFSSNDHKTGLSGDRVAGEKMQLCARYTCPQTSVWAALIVARTQELFRMSDSWMDAAWVPKLHISAQLVPLVWVPLIFENAILRQLLLNGPHKQRWLTTRNQIRSREDRYCAIATNKLETTKKKRKKRNS